MEKDRLNHDTLNQLTALALARVAFIEDKLDMALPAAQELLVQVTEANKHLQDIDD